MDGIVFCVSGPQFEDELEAAVARLSVVAPSLPVHVHHVPSMVDFQPKLDAMADTPFDRTIFFDTDTYCIDKPSRLFGLLEKFDVIMAPAPRERENRGLVPHNSGLVGFGHRALPMLRDAAQRYRDREIDQPHHPGSLHYDQIYIADGIARFGLRFWALPQNWNFRLPFASVVFGRVHVLHGRVPDYESVAREINRTEVARLWNPKTNTIRTEGEL